MLALITIKLLRYILCKNRLKIAFEILTMIVC